MKMASDEAELVVVMPPPAGGGTTVSRTVVHACERRGVRAPERRWHVRIQAARSVVLGSVRSVLCAPVIVADDVSAALCVASQQARCFFGNDDLELVTAVANLAALSSRTWATSSGCRPSSRTRPQLAVSHGLIGHSPAVQHVLGFVAKASRVDATVLVLGETGTGRSS
ncbi:MAG: GAF domain-containing protein [Vicinamibacterales bacterium]